MGSFAESCSNPIKTCLNGNNNGTLLDYHFERICACLLSRETKTRTVRLWMLLSIRETSLATLILSPRTISGRSIAMNQRMSLHGPESVQGWHTRSICSRREDTIWEYRTLCFSSDKHLSMLIHWTMPCSKTKIAQNRRLISNFSAWKAKQQKLVKLKSKHCHTATGIKT